MNDPNFWQKWAKKANIETETSPNKELILFEPRSRKKRFEQYKAEEVEGEESSAAAGDSDDSQDKRSGRRKKRRRAQTDAAYLPDELAFSKTDYFKIEKFVRYLLNIGITSDAYREMTMINFRFLRRS